MALEKLTEFDYPVIDMDCHIFEDPKVYSEYLEPKYREVWKEEFPPVPVAYGLAEMANGQFPVTRLLHGPKYRMHMETEDAYALNIHDPDYIFPGAFDPEPRLWCMDQEGIDAGIVRNTMMAGMFHSKNIELVDAMCRAYNNWIRDYCNADPKRLFPEALLPCGDMDLAIKELERTAALGFVGAVLPGSTAAPQPLSDPHWDPLFARMQELGWPLCIHTAFDAEQDSAAQWLFSHDKMAHPVSGSSYYMMMVNLNFMLDNIVTLGEITLGGMCDKFPNLNVYFIEAGHSWIGEVLYRLDKGFANPAADWFPPEMLGKAKTKPSEIFERQIYVPFEGGDQHYMSDMGMEGLSKNLVWASDIPHWDADGPWEGVGALRALKVKKEAEHAIMGKNAATILGIPYEKRVGTSANAKASDKPTSEIVWGAAPLLDPRAAGVTRAA